MTWILLSPPPLSSDPDNPPKFGTCTRSAKHEVHTIEVNKVALNRDDDKQISKKDAISTFARGHKDVSWSPILGELSLR